MCLHARLVDAPELRREFTIAVHDRIENGLSARAQLGERRLIAAELAEHAVEDRCRVVVGGKRNVGIGVRRVGPYRAAAARENAELERLELGGLADRVGHFLIDRNAPRETGGITSAALCRAGEQL